ncbi:MAG: T9SS type A sorting domain-containing protein, partial [Bacteroidota bacterium]|nr:T9SS type A sorting domain-containing protein [Bacteroidota bacterium]
EGLKAETLETDLEVAGNEIAALLDFKASYNGNFTLIEWRTVKEAKSDVYTLEVSNDEEAFTALAEVKALKSSHDYNSYSYIDNNNLIKDCFYRLRHLDAEGNTSFSQVVLVKVNPLNQLRLFPVPTKSTLNIKGFMGPFEELDIKIMDFNGGTYKVYNLNKISDDQYTIDLSQLNPNTYFIKISSNGKSANFRVLKL